MSPKPGSWRPLALLRPHWLPVGAGTAMVVAFCLLKLGIAHSIGRTIDGLRGPAAAGADGLRANIGLLVSLIVGEAVCRYFARRWIIDSSRHIEARLKSMLMRHMARLPVAWYDRARTGDLLSRLTQDVELVRFLIGPTVMYGAQILVTVPAGFVLMASLSTKVTVAIGVAFAGLLVAMLWLLPRMKTYSDRVQEDIGAISQHAQDSFAGIHVLLHFAKARVFAAQLDRLNERYVTDNMAMTRFRALVHLFIHLCTDVVVLCVLVFGVLEVRDGRMTLGGLVEFLTVMGFLVWPMIASGWILGTIHRARAAVQRIDEVLLAAPEDTAGLATVSDASIRVRDLTFSYPGESEPALHGIDFELKAGGKLGLVGAVGSGKSTLLHLLLRLYDPPRGTVWVGGHDVLDLELTALRHQFALAAQEPFLFSDT
ncbi:MAG: ABC transporter ATP-binding protein, partial [Planctomycetes bacterium]|nr:ABC transporter ATP-binding protein [Planctomycetota bacterium]